jgi:hypothetical protein
MEAFERVCEGETQLLRPGEQPTGQEFDRGAVGAWACQSSFRSVTAIASLTERPA